MTYDYSAPRNNGVPRTRKHLIWLKWALGKIADSGKKDSFEESDIPSLAPSADFGKTLPDGKLNSGWKQDIIDSSLRENSQKDLKQATYFRLLVDTLNKNNEQLISLFEERNKDYRKPEGPNAIAEMRRLFDEFWNLNESTESVDENIVENTDLETVGITNYTDTMPEDYTRADLLKRRKNIVLEGPPGTGKTFAMKAIIESLENDHYENIGDGRGRDKWAITMHPATAYEDFIEGLRPADEATIEASIEMDIDGSENGDESDSETNKSEKKQNCSNKFEYQPGVFVKRVKDAIQKPNEKHVVLLDELNRCNVPRVLGDLLTTVEADKRTKPVIPKANSEDPWYGKDVKIGVFGSKITRASGRQTGQGLRIYASCKLTFGNGAFSAKPSQHMIKYYDYSSYPNVGDVNEKSMSETENGRNMSGFFSDRISIDVNNEIWHEIAAFMVYEEICYPLILNKDEMIQLMNGTPLEDGEYTILSNNGLKRLKISNMANETNDANSARHKCTIATYPPEEICTCSDLEFTAEHYWCNSCDDKWDSKNRTEVILSGSEKKLHIPNNLYIVATMNTTDRSVAPLDAALRRRFVFIRVDPLHKESLPEQLENSVKEADKEIFQEVLGLWQTLNDKLTEYLGDDATIGHSYLFELVEQMNEDNNVESERLAQQFWQYSVLPQVADLLDATGNATSIWKKMDLMEQFKTFGVKIKTPSEQLQSRAFSRTIVSKI